MAKTTMNHPTTGLKSPAERLAAALPEIQRVLQQSDDNQTLPEQTRILIQSIGDRHGLTQGQIEVLLTGQKHSGMPDKG